MSVGKLPQPSDVIPFEVWSGGQTGADRGALEGARGACLPTGGFAPRDWTTEAGPDPELGTKFGLKECYEDGYPPRARENVLHCDVTVLIAANPFERGSELTMELCQKYDKPCYSIIYQGSKKDPMVNTAHEAYYLAWWLSTFPNLKRVNFAGNRESKAPGIQTFTRWLLVEMASCYRDRYWLYREKQPPFPGSGGEEEEAEESEEILSPDDLSSPEEAVAIAPSEEDDVQEEVEFVEP